MSGQDNPHALRLYESIKKHADEETANRIVNKIPLSKSANTEKKFAWAKNICADLEKEFGDDMIKLIRMDCACTPQTGKNSKLKKLYQSSADLHDFVDRANKLNQGFTMQYDGNALLLIYPKCYCSCVKKVEKPVSKSWCYCALGHTKNVFENIFGKALAVELIDSVKMGGMECRIKISNL